LPPSGVRRNQKIGAVDKRRRPRALTRAIRTAIDAVVFDRCTRPEACQRAGKITALGLTVPLPLLGLADEVIE
jgi:hypothetical protein